MKKNLWLVLSGIAILAMALSAFSPMPMSVFNPCKKDETFRNGHCEKNPPKCPAGTVAVTTTTHQRGRDDEKTTTCVPLPPAKQKDPGARCSERWTKLPGMVNGDQYMKFYNKHCAWVEIGGGKGPGDSFRKWFNSYKGQK